MKKKKFVCVILSVFLTIVIFPLMFLAYKVFYVEPWLESLHPVVRPYADPVPFFSTWYGVSVPVVWVFLGLCWLLRYKHKLYKKAIMAASLISAAFRFVSSD